MLNLAVVQFTPTHLQVEPNVQRLKEFIAGTEADLLVFPELATSGYFMRSRADVDSVAMFANDDRMQDVLEIASKHRRVVVFGFAERDGSAFFNSSIVGGYGVEPAVYRKSHLFYRERDVFAPGNTGFFVTNIPHLDCNLGMMICYDWRFPESARTLALRGADVIAVPSNLVTELWPRVMPARAAENKVYVAVTNRMGSESLGDITLQFNGRSTIYSYTGEALEHVGQHEGVAIAQIDPAATRKKSFSSYNDIFADRRPELYA